MSSGFDLGPGQSAAVRPPGLRLRLAPSTVPDLNPIPNLNPDLNPIPNLNPNLCQAASLDQLGCEFLFPPLSLISPLSLVSPLSLI